MINPLVVESLTVNNTTRRWNILYVKFVPNNFKECDLDLKIAQIQIDLDIFMIQNFVFGDGVFIILFYSLRGSISQNTGTLKC